MIDVNKMVLSDKVPCNNEKDWQYIAGYQVDGETIIPLCIKKPKNIFSCDVSQYDKKFTYRLSFNVSEALEWMLQYRNIWNDIESQLFEKLATGPIKLESKYVHGKFKMWKERIKKYFHGQPNGSVKDRLRLQTR